MMSIFGALVRRALRARARAASCSCTKALATAWAQGQHPGERRAARLDRHRPHAQARKQVAGLHERVLARTPAGRWGTPDDFAGIAVFLASPASDFVTGTAIPVDGGYSVQGV